MSSENAQGGGQSHLKKQDLSTLDINTLTPLSPEVISRQATINIGTIGHVAHGKSTVVKAISGVQTVRFKNELERNITIKLEKLTDTEIQKITESPSSLHNYISELNEIYPNSPYLRVPRRSKRNSVCLGSVLNEKVLTDLHYKQKSLLSYFEIKSTNDNFTPPYDVSRRHSGTPIDFLDNDIDNRSDYSTSTTLTSLSSGYGSNTGSSKRRKVEKGPRPNHNNEYTVENIVSIEMQNAKPMFQVKWFGYPNSKNTWEPLEHLRDNDLLEPFLARESVKIQEYKDELEFEMIRDVDFTLPTKPKDIKELFMKIKKLDEIELQADLIVLTMVKIYDKARYAKRMYQRVKTNLITKYFKDLRTEQLQKISEWECMINEKEPQSMIKVINDVDFDVPPTDFQYINSNIAGEGVTIPNTPEISCQCVDGCSYRSSCCAKLLHSHFAYRTSGVLRVPVGTPIYECNSRCSCPPDCPNRVVQQGRKHKLNIFKTNDDRGWGVRTKKYIPEGNFVCEYTGEIITFEEAEKRGQEYDGAGRTYLFDLDFYNTDNNYTIDASKYGNIARFINHSCEPNLDIYALWDECQNPNFQRIVFFSRRPIASGEELTIDYLNGTLFDKQEIPDDENVNPNSQEIIRTTDVNQTKSYERFRPNSVINKETCVCKCGAKNCRKFIF